MAHTANVVIRFFIIVVSAFLRGVGYILF